MSGELPRICKTEHLGGAIFIVSIETEACVVTARVGLDGDEMIVAEREGDLSGPAIAAIVAEFDAEAAHLGGVMRA